MKPNKPKGIIALSTAIIVSSVLLSIGIALLLTSIDNVQATSLEVTKIRLDTLERSCLEEATYTLELNRDFTGMVDVPFPDSYNGDMDCSINIIDGGVDTSTVQISTTIDGNTILSVYTVDTSGNVLSVTKE